MAGSRKKKTRAQPSLTSERIRDEALRLIEAEGLEAFSTRKLGRALGVEAMAIYWYYPSKDALLDAVVETLVAKLGGAAADDAAPRADVESPADFIDALRTLAHAYRGLAHAYPNAFPLLASRRFATEGTYRFLNDLFTLAEQHGLDARTTARFYRLVASYCSGVALNELAGLRDLEAGRDGKEAIGRLPQLASVFAWLAPEHHEDVFSFGLELLLSALREHAARPPPASPTATARPARAAKTSAKTSASKRARP
ncbi:MAG: TetR/AcrR family transcriptional regulator C-terminal domain-containing protein [Labilithrix sp.]|nr:TetR/AcrR family transcriptional regulator C-terminal domain-containing protein [Labilithrix sp.]MBX3218501.1 TetR/AcrR family transcriptional regulator C-terminal domain-containing protein [Labilithrix sp.]